MKSRGIARLETLDFFRFVAPVFLLYLVFFIVPLTQTVYYSFTDWNGIDLVKNWVGIQNYQKMLGDNVFWESLKFTGAASLLYMVTANTLGFLLAWLLNRSIKSKTALRALIFLPFIFNNVTVGFVWQFLLGRFMTELYAATGFPLFAVNWLSDTSIVTISVVLVKVWQSMGYYMILYLAGFQMLSTEPLESGLIDGCTTPQLITYILIPMMAPTIATCLFLSITDVLNMFPLLMTLTGGGPGHASENISLYIYNEAFKSQRMGYASAMAVLLAIAVLILTNLQLRLTKEE